MAVFHDENSNGEIDRNFAGMQKASVGASNMTGFGRPPSPNVCLPRGRRKKSLISSL
ncbi:DUF2141 domain-containing protein [Lewinella sp. LCG006]|uniref:DUF2141 domain-containing protein n=1 Tax=Lewinella sp. LCG006 TaxID=3231911 RepID=UPI00345F3AAC